MDSLGQFDVFLCHNCQEKAEVEKIREQLKQRGIYAWLDKYDFEPFRRWQDQLEEIIPQIKAAAIFIGSSGVGPWADIEMNEFLKEFAERKIRMGLVILPNCSDELIKAVPRFMKSFHWVDFRQSNPDPMEQLIWGITGLKCQDYLQELIQILTPVDFNTTVVKAYRDSLPELRHRPTPDNLEALVRLIADIPGQPDELKPLWRFVKSLIQDKSLDSDCQRAIEEWAKVQKIPLDLATETVQSQSETGETYLMIKVKFHPPDKYIVSAAIVEDPDPLKLEVERKETSIDIPIPPDPKYSPGYSQEQLPLILSELIAICGGKYSIPLTDLVVQWFLPIELMSLPIEHWQIPIGRQKPCNGERCKAVIVRSSERHFSSDYQSVLGEWKEHWKHLLDRIKLQSNQALEPLEPMTGKAKIEWSQTNAVGCTFIEHDDRQQQIDFWDNLLGQGLPIALWSRQPVTNKQKTKKIMKSVTESSLAELQMSLTKQRINALPKTSATTITSQPAAQLALLWDNPFRRFPDIQYESH